MTINQAANGVHIDAADGIDTRAANGAQSPAANGARIAAARSVDIELTHGQQFAAGDADGLERRAAALLAGERDAIANAANLSALIFGALADINWAGFYFVRGDELVLGPFQGQPACVRIARGAGVCGTAWAQRRTLVIPDVHAFPGHIACDSASRSEIVVPLVRADHVIGVLDIDSPIHDRFADADRSLIEALAALYVGASDLRTVV